MLDKHTFLPEGFPKLVSKLHDWVDTGFLPNRPLPLSERGRDNVANSAQYRRADREQARSLVHGVVTKAKESYVCLSVSV
jgi:hypothetical protein